MRRARRLLPTLLLVVAATLLVGFFMFPKDLTQDLGGSAVYSLLSISNIYFWLNSGYFDAGANLRPLLHTWSLAVEEQFYLVWPALLVGTLSLAASGRKALLIVLLFVGCGSFLAGELLLNGWGPTYIQQLAIDAETTTFFLAPFVCMSSSSGVSSLAPQAWPKTLATVRSDCPHGHRSDGLRYILCYRGK